MTPAATNHKRKAAGDAPRSGSEWRTALREVKREYFIGKYRSCVSRCDDLLAGAKITKSAQVIHLVYLHFYAASALEQQVRCLHNTSPYRGVIIDKARDHYRRAAVLADAENDNVKYMLAERKQTTGSSISHSPSLSLSSGSTRLSSPSPTPMEEKYEKGVRFKESRSSGVADHRCRPVTYTTLIYITPRHGETHNTTVAIFWYSSYSNLDRRKSVWSPGYKKF